MHTKEIQMETIFLKNQKYRFKYLNSVPFAGIAMTIIGGETKIL